MKIRMHNNRRSVLTARNLLSISVVAALAACSKNPADSIQIDADDIAGVVTSSTGPEAGVWVIAEAEGLPTKFIRSVVTDDAGRYVIPDLPAASYQVWVRGYGLADSAKTATKPGERVNITSTVAPDEATAAKIYPAAHWYAMMKIPEASELSAEILPGGVDQYLGIVKNQACVGCHQLGGLATRTLPKELGTFADSKEAWLRRIQSGQAGADMMRWTAGRAGMVPIKYLAEWTDRVAAGETPATKPERPTGIERNAVITVRDWSSPTAYMHDLISTDRRNPTVNPYGPLYGSPELSTDDYPILDPVKNVATIFKAPVRDADTPSEYDRLSNAAPSPYWGDEKIWNSKTNNHNPMLDEKGRVWYTARFRKEENPDFCLKGSNHPSAKLFPLERNSRQITVYEPDTGKYTYIDTCYGTHHLSFSEDGTNTAWTSGGGQVLGWFNRKIWEETGDVAEGTGLDRADRRHQRQWQTRCLCRTRQTVEPQTRQASAAGQLLGVGQSGGRNDLGHGRSRTSIPVRSFASIPAAIRRKLRSPKSTTSRHRASRHAVRTSIATASCGCRWAAVIWVNLIAASAKVR